MHVYNFHTQHLIAPKLKSFENINIKMSHRLLEPAGNG